MSPEARVGAVTVLAVVLAVAFALALPGTGLLRPQGYTIIVAVHDASGIAPGAPVRMAGVPVGGVASVGLSPAGDALIVLTIRAGLEIPEGSRVRLATTGLVGEQFVAIEPARGRPPIAPGAVVRGEDAFSLERTATRLEAAADQVARLVENANTLLADPEMRADLREAIRSAREATGIARDVLAQARGAVSSVERTATTVEAVAGSIRRVVDTDVVVVARDLRAMSENLVDASERVQALVESTAAEGALSRDIRDTATSLREAGQRIRQMAEDLQGLINPENVAKTREVVDDARAAVKDARTVVQQAGVVVRQAGSFVQRADRLLPERLSSRQNLVTFNYEVWHDGRRSGYGIDATLLPGAGRTYRLGLLDVGGTGGVVLQVGTRLTSTVWWRAGIYDSQLGLGLDYRPGALSFALDVYDLNAMTADARLRYQMTPRWGLMLGGRNLMRSPAFIFGLGSSF
jgi:phospholipid/cholesterol/gamma-HCH transport system substrate-binding protein